MEETCRNTEKSLAMGEKDTYIQEGAISPKQSIKKGVSKMRVSKELFNEMADMCKAEGVPDMFSREEILKQRVKDVADYVKSNGKYPSSKAKDPYVRTLGRWLGKMRKAHKNGEF